MKELSLQNEPLTILNTYLENVSGWGGTIEDAQFFIKEFLRYQYENDLITGEKYITLSNKEFLSEKDLVDEDEIIEDAIWLGHVVSADDYNELEEKYEELQKDYNSLKQAFESEE